MLKPCFVSLATPALPVAAFRAWGAVAEAFRRAGELPPPPGGGAGGGCVANPTAVGRLRLLVAAVEHAVKHDKWAGRGEVGGGGAAK